MGQVNYSINDVLKIDLRNVDSVLVYKFYFSIAFQ